MRAAECPSGHWVKAGYSLDKTPVLHTHIHKIAKLPIGDTQPPQPFPLTNTGLTVRTCKFQIERPLVLRLVPCKRHFDFALLSSTRHKISQKKMKTGWSISQSSSPAPSLSAPNNLTLLSSGLFSEEIPKWSGCLSPVKAFDYLYN